MNEELVNKPGNKKTKLGWILGDWECCKLNKVLDLLTDFEANGSFTDLRNNVKVYDKKNYAWFVRATDLENHIELNKLKYVDEKTYTFLRKTSLFGNELLITKRGEIGKIYFFEGELLPATLAPNLYLLKLNNKVISKYLFYYFINSEGNRSLKRINSSTTMGALYKDDVKKIKILLPPLLEQHKITQILSTWDNAIKQTERLIEAKQKLKKGLMQQLLMGKKRFKEFEGEAWNKVKLNKLIFIKSGDSPTKFELKPYGKYPFLKVEDLNNCNKYQIKSRNYTNSEMYKENRIPFQSIIFPKRGAAILTNKVRITKKHVFLDSNLMAIYPKNKLISPEYLYYTIVIEKLYKIADTSTIPQINNKHINPYKIYCPSLQEQEKIASVLSYSDIELELLEHQFQFQHQQKKGLMQKLLTGKIRVNT